MLQEQAMWKNEKYIVDESEYSRNDWMAWGMLKYEKKWNIQILNWNPFTAGKLRKSLTKQYFKNLTYAAMAEANQQLMPWYIH